MKDYDLDKSVLQFNDKIGVLTKLMFIFFAVFVYYDATHIMRMKLAGDYYEGMTDEEGRPLVKPGSDLGLLQQKARAKRMRIIKMNAGHASPGKGSGG